MFCSVIILPLTEQINGEAVMGRVHRFEMFNKVYNLILTKAATILRLLGDETIQLNTRGKKSEPGLRKQLNIDVKSTTKF